MYFQGFYESYNDQENIGYPFFCSYAWLHISHLYNNIGIMVFERGSISYPNPKSLLSCIWFEVRKLFSIHIRVSSLCMLPSLTFYWTPTFRIYSFGWFLCAHVWSCFGSDLVFVLVTITPRLSFFHSHPSNLCTKKHQCLNLKGVFVSSVMSLLSKLHYIHKVEF